MASQSAMYGLAGALGKGLGLLTVPILTRLLSPAEYGLADLANTMAAMMAMLAMFAGDIPASRLAGTAGGTTGRHVVLSTYVWSTVVLSVAIGALLLPLAGVLASDLWSAPDSTAVAILAIALIPISTVQASLVTTQRIESRPLAFAALATVDLLAQMAMAVAFVAVGFGALGMVAGYVVGSLLGLLAAAHQARRVISVPPELRLGLEMVREGLSFLPATLGFVVATYVVRFLLVDAHGQDAVGLFGVAFRLASGMALATAAFSMAWGPYGLSMPDNMATARLFGRVTRIYAAGSVLIGVAIGASGPELVSLISGASYADAAVMLPGLLMASALSGSFYIFLVAAGIARRGRAVAIAALLGAVSQVAATALLLQPLSLFAVGAAAAAGQAVAVVLLAGPVRNHVHRPLGALLILMAGAACSLVVQLLNLAPSDTQPFRLALSLAAGASAAAMMVTLVRSRSLGWVGEPG